MAQVVEAVYENGIFRPLQLPDLLEGQVVQLVVSSNPDPEAIARIRQFRGILQRSPIAYSFALIAYSFAPIAYSFRYIQQTKRAIAYSFSLIVYSFRYIQQAKSLIAFSFTVIAYSFRYIQQTKRAIACSFACFA
jgi:predicted DNA-binding antitoxin AbrB/MazE fold protein